jgi:4a-hydroxytetrahydrobiopterin dehydratase
MSMTELTTKRCVPCEGGVAPMDTDEARNMLDQLNDWELDESGKEISRSFKFKNYYETMAFVNALAWVAHREDHHPDLQVGYNRVHVRFSTHSIGGLSENDFICAAKIDALSN